MEGCTVLGRHGEIVVSTVASSQEGPEFVSRLVQPVDYYVEFACSPSVCMGFLRVLWFPPLSKICMLWWFQCVCVCVCVYAGVCVCVCVPTLSISAPCHWARGTLCNEVQVKVQLTSVLTFAHTQTRAEMQWMLSPGIRSAVRKYLVSLQ